MMKEEMLTNKEIAEMTLEYMKKQAKEGNMFYDGKVKIFTSKIKNLGKKQIIPFTIERTVKKKKTVREYEITRITDGQNSGFVKYAVDEKGIVRDSEWVRDYELSLETKKTDVQFNAICSILFILAGIIMMTALLVYPVTTSEKATLITILVSVLSATLTIPTVWLSKVRAREHEWKNTLLRM